MCNAAHLRRHANMWRIFWDNWEVLKQQLDRCEKWAHYVTPGHWPDAEMLPLSKIGVRGEEGEPRQTDFTPEEQQTLLTLGCIFRAPLLFGGLFPESSDDALGLVTKREPIAVDQCGQQPREFARDEPAGTYTWFSNTASRDGIHFALFNTSDVTRKVSLDLRKACVPRTSCVCDLWKRTEVGFFVREFGVSLTAYSSGLYQVVKQADPSARS